MKNKLLTKKAIIIIAMIIAVVVLIGWGYQHSKNTTPESQDTITLNQGTQTRFEILSIGLSNIDNNSAWLSIHKDGEEGSTNKQVVAGNTFDIYGYKIEIQSVNKKYNFSIKSGSSRGNVKFIIKKQ